MGVRRWLLPLVSLCLLASIVNYFASTSSVRALETHHESSQNAQQPRLEASGAPVAEKSPDFNFTDAVHVVVSRFMQHQPNLVALGRARLKLFEIICLQSMKFQDSNNFLWLILLDPELNDELLQEMKRMVAPHSNFFLISTLQSNIRFRSLNTSLVKSGDVNFLKRAKAAVRSKIHVYTRLDADDGLARTALRWIRTLAVAHLQVDNIPKDISKGWLSFCIDGHLEWHPSETEAGTLIGVQEPFCVTSGLTYAFAPGVGFAELPTTKHNRLHDEMPTCKSINQTACLHRTKEIKIPMAVRPRTATSGGMYGVGKDIDSNQKSFQQAYWRVLQSKFNIKRESLQEFQEYLNKNVRAIAQDNLDGQW